MVPLASLHAIVAVSRNGTIGSNGQLPWHFPGDLRLFRRMTLGHTVIMGRRTFQSLKQPLPGRSNWILSRRGIPKLPMGTPGVKIFPSLESLLATLQIAHRDRQFWVIGGAEIYHQLIPLCHTIVCSEIHRDYAGDVHWSIPPGFRKKELLFQCPDFTTHRWERNGIANS